MIRSLRTPLVNTNTIECYGHMIAAYMRSYITEVWSTNHMYISHCRQCYQCVRTWMLTLTGNFTETIALGPKVD